MLVQEEIGEKIRNTRRMLRAPRSAMARGTGRVTDGAP